jgi:aspartyl protease family protein
VIINGKQRCEMLVDTRAATLLLPYRVAVDAGVNVDAAIETTTGQVGGGSKIQTQRVLLNSVRVGNLTAKDVSCGVLPANITSAQALLGMSFLSQFKFELNARSSVLSLQRVDAEATATRKKKPLPKHTVKKSVKRIPSDNPQE